MRQDDRPDHSDRSEPTYAEVGATREGPLPPGYHHLRYRTLIGHGPDIMRAAADDLLEWRMHRAAGARIGGACTRVRPGDRVEVSLGIGPLRLVAPCRIIWTEDGERRAGFGYGTLPGHPARGEECFVVERDDDDAVWFTVTAFSRPARRIMRLAGPVAPLLQRAYAWACGRALRRLASDSVMPGK
ncbi:DUF1990 domain-containing protein [Actinoallomurus spadix]|uniref:DUF1990 domain-containing protein n=1 Tax=Actinoallomurus spadix TaxID=79912 RepID=A0ABN0W8B7_9ACTN|nr:DUF1990 domain-containing protein [Actinoallomurus spadix]MCO5988473.1 DUF1990 domain-containing protein [Actinoallomurus spadix]